MANLTESQTYDAGVYQLETTDPVVGGPDGISNAPLKNLANRTAYLKKHVDDIESGAFALPGYAKLNSPAFTGNPTAPNQAAGDNDTSIANTAFVRTAVSGLLNKSVAGGANITLTSVEAGYSAIAFHGELTADISVIVPSTYAGRWIFVNYTVGAFSLTVKPASGAGVEIPKAKTIDVYFDGSSVVAVDAPRLAKAQTISLSGDASGSAVFDGSASAVIPVTVADDSHAHSISTVAGLNEALNSKAPLNSPGFFGTPTAPTPAQFDSSTKLATTDFAWRQGLHFKPGAGVALTANTTLTASEAGHWFESQASNLTITLPPLASFSSGMATYTFRAPLAFTLKANGSELIRSASGEAANTLSVASGECVTVVGNGSGGHWFVVLGGFGSASFSKSFGMSGYQKLPSGLIIQWGSGATAADGSIAVTFPIAFPTACVGIHGTHTGSGMVVVIEELNTRSTTGVTTKAFNNLGQASSGWSVLWLAIGY